LAKDRQVVADDVLRQKGQVVILDVPANTIYDLNISGRNVRPFDGRVIVRAPTKQQSYGLALIARDQPGEAQILFYDEPNPSDVSFVRAEPLVPRETPLIDPKVPNSELLRRVTALTCSFEYGTGNPDKLFSDVIAYNGAISVGFVEWSNGLPALLKTIQENRPEELRRIFNEKFDEFTKILSAPEPDQKAWAKSISTPTERLIEPWNTSFQRLGATREFQDANFAELRRKYNGAIKLCEKHNLHSQRAVALMFDTIIQGTGLRGAVNARLPSAGEADEVTRMAAVVDSVVAVVPRQWKESIRNRKLTIVHGHGVVYGISYDLSQFGITLNSWKETRE
jgi:hypothetical protein